MSTRLSRAEESYGQSVPPLAGEETDGWWGGVPVEH
jgi:hypothetical protein